MSVPYIYNLPSELLAAVITDVVSYRRDGETYYSLGYSRALALTCKRFKPIAQSLLFHTIHLLGQPSSQLVPPGPKALQFFRAVEANPSLRTHVRELDIAVLDFYDLDGDADAFVPCLQLGLWLANVRKFGVRGGFDFPLTWAMVRSAVGNMSMLEELELSAQSGSPGLRDIVRAIDSKSLKKLVLARPGAGNGEGAIVPVSKKGTATITSLEINAPTFTSEDFADFITWPKRLESFTYTGVVKRPAAPHLSWITLHTALAPHARTLKRLTLTSHGPTSLQSNSAFHLKDYESLTHLQISIYEIDCDRAAVAAAKLTSPHLQSITFDYTVLPRNQRTHWPFDEVEARWMREYAIRAKEHSVAFQHIMVIFSPSADCLLQWKTKFGSCKDPWIALSRAAKRMEEIGVKFEYSEPNISGADWDQLFES